MFFLSEKNLQAFQNFLGDGVDVNRSVIPCFGYEPGSVYLQWAALVLVLVTSNGRGHVQARCWQCDRLAHSECDPENRI